jgi:hypothetical protein
MALSVFTVKLYGWDAEPVSIDTSNDVNVIIKG